MPPGCHLVLYLICFQALLATKNVLNRRRVWIWLAYISSMFVLATLGNAFNLKLNELAFVDDRTGPEGPVGYLNTHFNNFFQVARLVASIVNGFFQDMLLVSDAY